MKDLVFSKQSIESPDWKSLATQLIKHAGKMIDMQEHTLILLHQAEKVQNEMIQHLRSLTSEVRSAQKKGNLNESSLLMTLSLAEAALDVDSSVQSSIPRWAQL